MARKRRGKRGYAGKRTVQTICGPVAIKISIPMRTRPDRITIEGEKVDCLSFYMGFKGLGTRVRSYLLTQDTTLIGKRILAYVYVQRIEETQEVYFQLAPIESTIIEPQKRLYVFPREYLPEIQSDWQVYPHTRAEESFVLIVERSDRLSDQLPTNRRK